VRRPFVIALAATAVAVPLAFAAVPAQATGDPVAPQHAGGVIASPLPPGQQPDGLSPKPAICPSGAERCVDSTVARMQRTYETDGCSHNATFADLYLDTTLSIRDAIRNDEFSDRPFWNRITQTFGTYYLDSYKAWTKGEETRVPQAWQIAFDAAAAGTTSTLGDIYLGINAHVNRDLAFVYYQTGADNYADHYHVNEVLGRAAGVAYPDIYAHLDNTVYGQAAAVPAGFDLPTIFRWRDEAWDNAERLREAPDAEARAAIAAEIDANALEHAREIEAAFPAAPGANAARDAFCASHR
jgi:hypothetical protein